MTDFLSTVVRERRAYVAAARAVRPVEQMRRAAEKGARARGTLSLGDTIRKHRARGTLAVIAEVKRVSPALGPLSLGVDPASLAERYQEAGATAISVLVEPHHWGGSLDDIRAVVPAVSRERWLVGSDRPEYSMLPVMAKDVIVDRYQVYEACAAGAHAILLIAEALTDEELDTLVREARTLGMDVLLEAHEPAAFARAVRIEADLRSTEEGPIFGRTEVLLGVNARDLRQPSHLDRTAIHRLAPMVEPGPIVVAESGITSVEDAEALPRRVDAVLVGTALMRAGDPAPLVSALSHARPGRALA